MAHTEIQVLDKGAYMLTKVDDKTGKVLDSITEHAVHALDGKAVGQILQATIKSSGSRRDGFLSYLGMVYNHPRLDGFKAKGDRVTGRLSPEFKAAVRDVESAIMDSMIDAGHIKLPKNGTNAEEAKQSFLSGLRDDKNYSNAKNTTNKYFALVGANCVTQAGFIVPFTVMQAQISDVVDRPPVDNSVAAKLRAVEEKMNAETIDAADALACLDILKRMLPTMQGIVNHYAELATNARSGVDVKANAVLERAAESAKAAPMKATPPTRAKGDTAKKTVEVKEEVKTE